MADGVGRGRVRVVAIAAACLITAAVVVPLTVTGGQPTSSRTVVGRSKASTSTVPPTTVKSPLPAMSVPVSNLAFVSPTTAWAAVDPILERSTDGGRSWARAGPAAMFNGEVANTTLGVAFGDATHAWVALHDWADPSDPHTSPDPATAVVWRTTDGGATWAPAPLQPLPPAFGAGVSLTFADLTHGWAAVAHLNGPPSLFATTDGGATWTALPPPPAAGRIAFSDPTHGLLLAYGAVYRTADAGRSWTKVAMPKPWPSPGQVPPAYGAIAARGATVILEARQDTGTVIYTSPDRGVTWSAAPPTPTSGWQPAGGAAQPFTALTTSRWYLVAGAEFWSTTDAGAHWQRVRSDQTFRGGGTVGFLTPSVGWATIGTGSCAPQCAITPVATNDGGHHWRVLPLIVAG